MKVLLEALQSETIPKEFVEILNDMGVRFYDGKAVLGRSVGSVLKYNV